MGLLRDRALRAIEPDRARRQQRALQEEAALSLRMKERERMQFRAAVSNRWIKKNLPDVEWELAEIFSPYMTFIRPVDDPDLWIGVAFNVKNAVYYKAPDGSHVECEDLGQLGEAIEGHRTVKAVRREMDQP